MNRVSLNKTIEWSSAFSCVNFNGSLCCYQRYGIICEKVTEGQKGRNTSSISVKTELSKKHIIGKLCSIVGFVADVAKDGTKLSSGAFFKSHDVCISQKINLLNSQEAKTPQPATRLKNFSRQNMRNSLCRIKTIGDVVLFVNACVHFNFFYTCFGFRAKRPLLFL